MDPTTIFTSAKVAYDIAKGISALKSEVERNQAVSRVLEVLLAVQQDALSMQKEHNALLTEKNNLEAQLLTYDTWEKEKTIMLCVKLFLVFLCISTRTKQIRRLQFIGYVQIATTIEKHQ
jgi:hypothetical protein